MNFNLTEHSTDVVGWDSTWDTEKQVHVRDSSTETLENSVEISEKSIGTSEQTKEIGVQASPLVLSNSNDETDKKLAAWLRKIMPALEKELIEGTTQVHDNSSNQVNVSSFAKVSEYQQIDVKSSFPESNEELIIGHAVWLSVILQNNPVLVISCSLKSSPNEPSSSYLILFEPQRSKVDGNIYWKEVTSIPIKEPLEYLVVNSENRDIFAGASSSGDFYIWEYVKPSSTNTDQQIIEIFSKGCEDSIAGITFLADNTFVCCFGTDGNIVSYKIIGKQNCIIDKVMKVDQRRLKDSHITAITNIDKSNDFVIGLLNGKIFYCSTNQFVASDDNVIDPIVREMSSHKFAVKTLKHGRHSNKNFVISFDASSEIFIHEIDEDPNEKSLKFVIRLPLPIKNCLAVTNNMEHIFCPLANGNLEIFNARNQTRRVMEGNNSGNNMLAELSKNESWLITGIFKGSFKLYYISVDDEK
ncbi:uncharacterized protein [Chironomus tepperi]|uniref:uncharacterized protein n=1 Tax=Chironomus tepperi TaxID=113505 RepID=UPI00391EF195